MILHLIAVEVLARVVRRSVLHSIAGEGRAPSLTTANDYLQRAACFLFCASQARFEKGLLPLLRRMFWFDETIDAGMYVQLLKRILQRKVVVVTKRICELCGLREARGNMAEIVCQPSHHNYSFFYSPEHQRLLAALVHETSKRPTAFKAAYLVPQRIRFFCRGGRHASARREATQLAHLRSRDMLECFLNAEAWTAAALMAARCGSEEDSADFIKRATGALFDIPTFLSIRPPPTHECRLTCVSSRARCTPSSRMGSSAPNFDFLKPLRPFFSEALRLPDVAEDERQPHVPTSSPAGRHHCAL
ncbi:hypothetical protein LSCM1_05807 [Leishmania martiniquensis]|uniref:Uncharacterized protein n=1 Tax=Leishmania martiniquensis TaxID=1580590 RepID=A0A836HIT4_9TRYP|nr:hypothetical protein LSCM1_05807 [Leishmania martiniquensis]